MRAALGALLLAIAAPASAAVPLALAARQVETLEFSKAVEQVTTTDPDLLVVQATGTRVRVEAVRGGHCKLELTFADGASVSYEVTVEAARGPTPPPAAKAAIANEIVLSIGEERRLRAPGVARVLYEENGVARIKIERETVAVIALASGRSSVVLVDGAGEKTTFEIQVR